MQQPPGQPPQWQPPPPSGHGPPGAPPPSYGAPQGYPQGYPAPPQPPPKKGMSGTRLGLNILGGVILLGLVIIGGLMLLSNRSSDTSAPTAVGGGGGPLGILGGPPPPAPPQTLYDDDLPIDAHGDQRYEFTFNGPAGAQAPLKVTATGKKHTDKGFDFFVMDKANCDAFASGSQSFSPIGGLSAYKVESFARTASITPGTYCVVIRNKYNFLDSMIVHVTIVANAR